MSFVVAARPPMCADQGHMFWCAPTHVIEDTLRKEAELKRVPFDSTTSWHDLLCAGDQERLLVFDKVIEESRLSNHSEAVRSESGRRVVPKKQVADEMICQPQQNCGGAMGQLTSFVPTLLRRSLVWSQRHKRPLIGKEHLVVMGMPAFSREMSGDVEMPWLDAMGQFEDSTLKAFAGNAVHSMIAGALSLWALCCFVPHEHASLRVQSPLPAPTLLRGFSTDFAIGGAFGNEVERRVRAFRAADQDPGHDPRKRRRLRAKTTPSIANCYG